MKMKIGVLADTHLHRTTREFRAIFSRFLADADVILHAGDFVGSDIVDFLSKRNFHGVHGNMDTPEIKESLPRKRVLELGGFKIGLIHGWGASEGLEDRIRPEFRNPDVIVYGHSHKAANHVREGVLLFNPGTATGFTSSGIHTVGVLTLEKGVQGGIIGID
jgi:putative phosphoesterase